jgi:hypothetical protein
VVVAQDGIDRLLASRNLPNRIALASAIAAALAVTVGVVAHHDAQQRVLIHEADLALTENISRFWTDRGTLSNDYFVGRVTVPGLAEGPYPGSASRSGVLRSSV